MSREGGRFLLVGVYAGLGLLVVLFPAPTAAAARSNALRFLWPAATALGVELVFRFTALGRDSGVEAAAVPVRPARGERSRERGAGTRSAERDPPRPEVAAHRPPRLRRSRGRGGTARRAAFGGAPRGPRTRDDAHGVPRGHASARAFRSARVRTGPARSAARSSLRSRAPSVDSRRVVPARSRRKGAPRVRRRGRGDSRRGGYGRAPARVPQRARQRGQVHAGGRAGAREGERRLAARVRRDQRHGSRDDAGGAEARVHVRLAEPVRVGVRRAGARNRPRSHEGPAREVRGKISLLSEPGHGLEVTIMFPVSREAGA